MNPSMHWTHEIYINLPTDLWWLSGIFSKMFTVSWIVFVCVCIIIVHCNALVLYTEAVCLCNRTTVKFINSKNTIIVLFYQYFIEEYTRFWGSCMGANNVHKNLNLISNWILNGDIESLLNTEIISLKFFILKTIYMVRIPLLEIQVAQFQKLYLHSIIVFQWCGIEIPLQIQFIIQRWLNSQWF